MSARSFSGRLGAEVRALLALATPIIIAQMAHTAMGFVDALMAGRVGARDLAAVALGNSIWVPVYLAMTGMLMATTPKVAQHFGAGRLAEIGVLVRQALWLASIVGCAAGALLWCTEPVLTGMGVDPELTDLSMRYLRAIGCGLPATALYYVLRCCNDSQGHTRPSMLIGIAGLLLNIPLNYVFIYGKLGVPAMGGVGCGWATATVMWAMLLGMLAWVKRAGYLRPNRLFARVDRPDAKVLRDLISVGGPIGVAVFAESSIFAVIALLIGGLGATVVAGHQIALNVSSLTFMVPLSLGMAVTVRVGQALGRGEPRAARFGAGVGIATALGYAVLSASLMAGLSEPLARIYTTDPAVIGIAATLLVYAALFQFSDAIQVIAAGALRGYQDTRATMLITLFAYWGIGLPVGYALGLSDWLGLRSGPAGLWQGLIAGLTCAALLLALRLQRRAWRAVRGRY